MYKMKSRESQSCKKEQPDMHGPNFQCKIGASTKLIAVGRIQYI